MFHKFKRFIIGLTGVLTACSFALPVSAAGEITLLEKELTEQGVAMYVDANGNTGTASFMAGTTSCTVDSVEYIGDMDDNIYTLILWDNSQSVMKKWGDTIKEVLLDIVGNKKGNEYVSIATLSKELTFETRFTDDYSDLKSLIKDMDTENKDAYIIENVYDAISQMNTIDGGFKRIILISDGMDNTEIGYSKEELDTLISDTPMPIYTIGMSSKSDADSTELQNMFALSRSTGAQYFYLNDIASTDDIVESIKDDYKFMQILVSFPADICDGSTLNTQLAIGTATVTCEVRMPFVEKVEEPEEIPEEPESIPEETVVEPELEPVVEPEPEPKKNTFNIFGLEVNKVLVIVVAAVLAIAIIVTVIVLVVKAYRKKHPEKGNDYASLDEKLKNERNHGDFRQQSTYRGSTGYTGAQSTPPAPVPGNAGVQTAYSQISGQPVRGGAASAGAAQAGYGRGGRPTRGLGGPQTPAQPQGPGYAPADQPGQPQAPGYAPAGQPAQPQGPGYVPAGQPAQPQGPGATQMLGAIAPQAPAAANPVNAPQFAHNLVLTCDAVADIRYVTGFNTSVILGRVPGCGLVIDDDAAVSGNHCEIGASGSIFYIKDLGSSNGTFVNGYRISAATEIRSGCKITVGQREYTVSIN